MTAGDVVLLHFPFSDLSGSKLRPAVVLANVGNGDFVAGQVTSNRSADAIELTAGSFTAGSLRTVSYARPGKLFTANIKVVSKYVGRLTDGVRDQIKVATIEVIRHG